MFPGALQRGQCWISVLLLLLSFAGGHVTHAGQASPKVVVSVKPLHSIVAGVMQGVGDPVLLISGSETPHGFSLRPSQARELQNAALVFWVGPELEQFLKKSITTLAGGAEIIALGQAVPLLSYRKHGLWRKSDGYTGHDDDGHKKVYEHADHYAHGTRDPHFWLDPVLMRKTVPVIARALSKMDPAHASLYRTNSGLLEQRLEGLHRHLERKLAPVRQIPYLVFHDAYQYLETRYRLASVGTMTLDPERRPGARHLANIRHEVRHNRAKCLFKEPQFKSAIISVVKEAVAVRIGELDPLGIAQRPGPDAYFGTLIDLAENLVDCLSYSTVKAK